MLALTILIHGNHVSFKPSLLQSVYKMIQEQGNLKRASNTHMHTPHNLFSISGAKKLPTRTYIHHYNTVTVQPLLHWAQLVKSMYNKWYSLSDHTIGYYILQLIWRRSWWRNYFSIRMILCFFTTRGFGRLCTEMTRTNWSSIVKIQPFYSSYVFYFINFNINRYMDSYVWA